VSLHYFSFSNFIVIWLIWSEADNVIRRQLCNCMCMKTIFVKMISFVLTYVRDDISPRTYYWDKQLPMSSRQSVPPTNENIVISLILQPLLFFEFHARFYCDQAVTPLTSCWPSSPASTPANRPAARSAPGPSAATMAERPTGNEHRSRRRRDSSPPQ